MDIIALKKYMKQQELVLKSPQDDIDGSDTIPEACTETTYQKVRRFILDFYAEADRRQLTIQMPQILLSVHGNVNIRIRDQYYDLLMVVYKEPKDPIFTIDNYWEPSVIGSYPTDKSALFNAIQQYSPLLVR